MTDATIMAVGAVIISVIGAVTTAIIQIMGARRHDKKLEGVRIEVNGKMKAAIEAAKEAAEAAVVAAFARGSLAQREQSGGEPVPPESS